jgi:hypothetical protein
MSDINTYADEAAITALTPINGDLVLNRDNNSLYLCTDSAASGINRWKKFTSDSALNTYLNRWGASFGGSNDYLDCGDVSPLNSISAFTISMWVNFQQVTGSTIMSIFTAGTSTSNRIEFVFNNVNELRFGLNGSVNYCSFNISSPTDYRSSDGWHNIVGTYNGTDVKLFFDGSQVGSTANSVPSATSSTQGNDTTVGRRTLGGGSFYFIGLMDDVAIWDSALSSTNITNIYNGGVPTDLTLAGSYDTDRTANLKAYWRMGDDSNDSASAGGSIATITDSSGNGNNATQGTASSQPTFKAHALSTTSLDFSLDYLDCGGASDFSFTDGSGTDSPFSVSAWVKLDSTQTARVLSKDTGTGAGAREYLFGTNGNSKVNMLLGHGSVNLDVQNNTTLNTTDWFHIAATYDGSKSASGLKVYVNGDGSDTVNSSAGTYAGMPSTTGNLEIGRFGNGHSFFNGLMDDVAVFNSEISASDVSSLAASRGAHIVNDLSLSPVAYYRMGEDDSLTDGQTGISQITDASGNGNHATQSTAANQPTASVNPGLYV